MNNIYKDYCYEVFDIETKKENISNASLKVVYNPLSKSYGSLSPNINDNKYLIIINLFNFKDMNHEDKLFYIYNTICHEIEHIKTFEKTKEDDFYNYNHIMTLMEYITYLSDLKLSPNRINMGVKAKLLIGKRLNRNYKVSLSEINSLLVGYKKAIGIKSFENKKETIDKIIETLQLLNNSLEISYGSKKEVLDNFGVYYIGTIKYLREYPEVLKEYKVLNNFFYPNGQAKDVYTLYRSRNKDNYVLYDRFILNIIMETIDNSYVIECMKLDVDFKKYIELLIHQYIDNSINFINNLDKCKLIIPEDEILNDNVNMIMKSQVLVNDLINKSNMEIKSSMIF